MKAVVEEAETFDVPATLKWSHQICQDSQLLVARSAALRTDITALIARSSSLIRQSRYLAPYPIRGGLDDRGLVLCILTDGSALCADCIANKTGIPHVEIPSVLERVRGTRGVETPDTPCTACLSTWKVYRLAPLKTPATSVILGFLRGRPAKVFCTGCISARLFNGRDIDVAMRHIEGRGIRRHHGRCSECGKPRLVAGVIVN